MSRSLQIAYEREVWKTLASLRKTGFVHQQKIADDGRITYRLTVLPEPEPMFLIAEDLVSDSDEETPGPQAPESQTPNPRSRPVKLLPEQVAEIRARHAAGKPDRLMEEFGIGRETFRRVLNCTGPYAKK